MRSRNLKPSFFVNEDLAECSPLARILFMGLTAISDREGRLEYRPKRIKVEVLPYDDCNIEELLRQLAKHDMIVRYIVGEQKFIFIPSFQQDQNPHIREHDSTYPAPPVGWHDSMFESKVSAEPVPGRCSVSAEPNLDFIHENLGVQDENLGVQDENLGVQDENPSSVSTVLGCLIPDSGFLIPDSNIMSSTVSSTGLDGAHLSKTVQQGRDVLHDGPLPVERIPYAEIVAYLNEETGKQFKANNQETRRLIKARWNQGFRLEDFERVISSKSAKWGTNPEMVDYLRPSTLFGSKFEAYLNEGHPREPSSQSQPPKVAAFEDDIPSEEEREELLRAIERGEIPSFSDVIKKLEGKTFVH